jgi:hypothetical protein
LTSRSFLPDRLRPGQAAAVLGIPPRTLRTLREQGILAGELSSGGQWTYDRCQIESLAGKRGSDIDSNDARKVRLARGKGELATEGGTLRRLRDQVRRYASRLTTTDQRFPADHPIASLCDEVDQDPYFWRWDTQSSDECFRLAMRRVESRISGDAELYELQEIVKQSVTDYIWDRVEERGGFCVHIEIDASIPFKQPR